MTKTPEEIKQGIECCYAMDCDCLKRGCPYNGMRLCHDHVLKDARDYILKLEEENKRMMNCYDAAVCESADVVAMLPKWISVEERLPEKGKTVLVAFADGYVTIGTLWGDCWNIPYTEFEEPVAKGTWWMPLPEPPEVTKP